MKNLYLKFFMIWLIVLTDFSIKAQSAPEANSLISQRSSSSCDVSIPNGGFTDGIECNEADYEIAANDILVPADTNLTLNSIMANMVLEEGETITSATIWIFQDEYGYPYMYPGYEVTSQDVTPTSHTLVSSGSGMDFYEVVWDLSPILLEGQSDYATRYWIGISATTTDGSTPYWEVTSNDMIGQPAAYSTGSWFDMYDTSKDGTYIFYADCEPIDSGGGGTTDCGAEIANGGFTDGIECNEDDDQIAANDILVPADSNLTLNSIMANMVIEEGETITSATIWIFQDEYGYPYMYPGYEVTSQDVTPTSHTLVSSGSGMDFYEVVWDLSPILLEGQSDYATRYWIGISATTTDGSTPYWEVTSNDMIGQPAAYSTGSWFDMYDTSKDGTYIFYADCEPIDSGGGGGTTDCGAEIANGGFTDGIECNEDDDQIAANDILVPADSNLTLNSIMANMVIEEGETITSATIWIFQDEYGYPYMYPGYEVTSQDVTPASHTLVSSGSGMDFYEVVWDLSPILLEGQSDYATRYWIGISATTTDGSTPYWEVTSNDMIGQPAAYSTGSWFDMYDTSKDGTYIFYADCEPIDSGGGGGTTDCGAEIANGGFTDGIECNEDDDQIAANDILVPADSNLTLNSIMANMVIEEGETITSATIWIFQDEYGYPYMYPGYEVTSQDVTPTSHTLVSSGSGMDFYEVVWDLSPILLEGQSDYATRYWIGISATTTDGSTPYWEVTSNDMIGQPAAYSTGSWFDMYDTSKDGTYIFYADCEPIDSGGGGTTDCGAEIANGGFNDGIQCNENDDQIAANDILVPADTNLTLNSIMANMVIEEGETITSATIWIFEDEYGYPYMYPGYEVTSQVVTPASDTLVSSGSGMDFYEVVWDLSPILLEGQSDYATRYWIGISATTTDGSTPYWEVTSNDMIGQPAAYSTGSWFDMYSTSKDGTYIFYAECEPIDDEGGGGDPGNDPGEACDVSLEADTNFVGEGINCVFSGHSNTRYAANDFIVAQGTDKVLTAIKPSLILNAGVSVDAVQVRIYKDNNGLPGEEINEQWVGITSMDLRTSFDDKEVYEVLIDLEPVFLRGFENVDTVYWVGIAVSTSDSSVPYWEVTYENSSGNPSALNTGANYSSPNPDQDGVYTFYATCYDIDGNNGPNEGYCDYSFLDINQNEDADCFGMVSDGGMYQSFTATELESSGAGIKFTDPSRGLEVTLSLWDGLSTQGGTMLTSQTTHTYGDQWVDVFWDEAVNLEIGSEYFLRIEGDDDLSCIRAGLNPYPEGQAYSRFNAYPDYDYTFRTYYCNDISCVQMDYGSGGYFQNSTLTSKDQDNLLATDITVPVGENFTIDKLNVYVWVLPGANINDADIVFYQDDNGSPGEIIRTDQNIVPATANYLGTGYGYDWYEVDFEVAPLFLSGKVESISTYWVSLNIGTNIGSAYMSLSSSIIMGYESYNSPDNGTTWEVIEGWETKYEFSGVCRSE